jgi:hypothetical protein
MSGSPRRLGRKFLVATAGVVVVAAAVGGGLWARSDRQESASPAVQAAVAVQPASINSLAVSLASGGYTPHTVYIVGSEEQAASVWSGINDANVIRDNQNLPPLLDEVVVAQSDDEVAAMVAGFNDGNAILAALYGAENRIVNLRG